MCVENWIWNAIEYRIYLHDENNQTGNDITILAASPHNSNWFFVSKDEWIYQCLLTLSYHFNVRLISTDNIVWLWFFRRHFYYCKYLRRAFEELNKKSFMFFSSFSLFICMFWYFVLRSNEWATETRDKLWHDLIDSLIRQNSRENWLVIFRFTFFAPKLISQISRKWCVSGKNCMKELSNFARAQNIFLLNCSITQTHDKNIMKMRRTFITLQLNADNKNKNIDLVSKGHCWDSKRE